MAKARTEPRYSAREVGYFPREPHPELLVIGEAPGPRGADRTGYPFWGDDSGVDIYGLIARFGLMDEPFVAYKRRTDLSGTCPPRGRYCITNACPRMPLAPGGGFCAPTPQRLEQEALRIAEEIRTLSPRIILACGRAATFTLGRAAEAFGGAVPESLRGKSFAGFKLREVMHEVLESPEPWRIGASAAFVTTHPSRGSWSPSTPAGKLHAQIVNRISNLLGRTVAG